MRVLNASSSNSESDDVDIHFELLAVLRYAWWWNYTLCFIIPQRQCQFRTRFPLFLPLLDFSVVGFTSSSREHLGNWMNSIMRKFSNPFLFFLSLPFQHRDDTLRLLSKCSTWTVTATLTAWNLKRWRISFDSRRRSARDIGIMPIPETLSRWEIW